MASSSPASSTAAAVEEARKKANLRLLKRLDRNVVDVVGSASYVVLYEFSDNITGWKKCDIEGSLFVVKRDINVNVDGDNGDGGASRFKLIVLNRNSTENMDVPITSKFQMQLNEPYLIFRSKEREKEQQLVRGIWFHSAEERETVHELLNRIIQNESYVSELEKKQPTPSTKKNDKQDSSKSNGGGGGPTATTTTTSDGDVSASSSSSDNAGAATAAAATTALLSSLSLSENNSTTNAVDGGGGGGGSPTPATPAAAASPAEEEATASSSTMQERNLLLDKKNLQLTLMSLIQDERFLDLIHAQYLKVARARGGGGGGGSSGSGSGTGEGGASPSEGE